MKKNTIGDASHTVLLVEDSPTLAALYQGYLHHETCQVVPVNNGADALAFICSQAPAVVLLDLELPDMNGMEILKYINQQQLNSVVVIITAHGSVDMAVEAMRYKALDFIEKPFDAKRLIVTLNNALRHYRLTHMLAVYQQHFDRSRYHGFIGASLPMQAIYRIIDSAAHSKATVFVTGESGTGKELCAEAIHKQSKRHDRPFVALNCAAIPADLMESEMFGHVKGAFTGAINERQGAAARADGGTLFLDEIGDMSLDLQSKLLRFIQSGTFQKVGGNKLESVDVRFVCATHRDPLAEVQAGRFRGDLYYRLHVIPIQLPPLREREGDVLLIARELLARYAHEENKSFRAFSPEVEAVFIGYDWPGNVRQLDNIVRSIVVLNTGLEVTLDMLPPPLAQFRRAALSPPAAPEPYLAAPPDSAPPEIKPLWQVEKDAIEQAIAWCEGNIPQAAARLEISASTIYRKRQHWAHKS